MNNMRFRIPLDVQSNFTNFISPNGKLSLAILEKKTSILFDFSPDNVRARSDLFYLQPERSCVPDSPVWYSTHELNEHAIDKMLRRILMVREVQEHMLADGHC